MSSRAMKWAQQQIVANEGLAHLLNVLAMAADRHGCSWRSQLTLAEQLAVSERAVRQRLAALAMLGIIQRAHRSNGRGGRSSDMVRLRLDRQFTVTKAVARAALQPANSAGSKQSSNRQISSFQPADSAGDKVSEQLKVESYQEKHPQSLQSAQRARTGEKPTLAVVNGGRA